MQVEVNMPKTAIMAGLGVLALAHGGWAGEPGRPLFVRHVGLRPNIVKPTALSNWTFSWTYNGQQYNAVFVGTNPNSGAATTIPSYIIPVALKYGSTEESPLAKDKSGKSVVDYTIGSPIFQSGIDFVLGGTDIGKTQYPDAFQRAALWGAGVEANPGYHVLLGKPKIEKQLVLTADSQADEFGVKVLLLNIETFDADIQATIRKYPANSLPLFVTTQTYLTTGGACCIGGYHNYTGTQSYGMFTYIQGSQVFAEDVSALSQEVADWIDDPLDANETPCGSYAVGAEGDAKHPYGNYPYKLDGFTYHLQNLLFPPYFGAPTSTSVKGWFDFHNVRLSVCGQQG
jgi:hypothetical protein